MFLEATKTKRKKQRLIFELTVIFEFQAVFEFETKKRGINPEHVESLFSKKARRAAAPRGSHRSQESQSGLQGAHQLLRGSSAE